ncbi:hypothetical protein SAMN05660472_02543 [Natronincola ferrireducens]|uniref:Uncharacterized protein n=1 Tax=Natronincola ferrireducens TaxID=393762 RepID=A0A1G9H007_9FIRM|nr:hypothetical protein SAMN05660472_02543 [Natronincola ferrireducens]
MTKHRALMISLISIILFNIFFMIMLIWYQDIIILPSDFSRWGITEEYYWWYMDRPPISNETTVIAVNYILKLMFSSIFLLEVFYIISNNKYKHLVKKKNLLISIIISSIVYFLSLFFIKYKTEHYRLFMTLISTEILSLILLNLLLRITKEIVKS